MKILIAYASAGRGHQRAAEAVSHYLRKKDQGFDITLVDVLDYSSAFYNKAYRLGYSLLVTHLIWLWGFLFWLTASRWLRGPNIFFLHTMNFLNGRRFIAMVVKEDFDVIISTHFLPSQICAYLKRKGRIKSRIVTIITDFGVHPYWVHQGMDVYITASSQTKELLRAAGVSDTAVKDIGIPIEDKFPQHHHDRAALSIKLGLDQNKFTCLIITGSLGIGPIEQIVERLSPEVQIIAVCALNERLCRRLKAKNYPNTHVYGFVNNTEELMAVSDVIITKPGGLSISEILVMGIAPVFISPIPGQETQNAKIMQHYGIGIIPRNIDEIKMIVLDYMRHPEHLKSAQAKIQAIRKLSSLEDLYHVICQGCSRPAD